MKKKKRPFGNRQIEMLERLNYLAKKSESKGLTELESDEKDKLEEKVKSILSIW